MSVVKLNPEQRPGKGAFCETETALGILDAIRRTHEERTIGLILGAPGVGKTTALREYLRTHPGAKGVTFSAATEALVPALQKIAEAFGAIAPNTGAKAVRDAIVDRISYSVGNDLILILDECHQLDDKPISEIVSLHDELKLPIVFCGELAFEERLQNSPAARYRTWKPLRDRVGVWLRLKGPTGQDIAALCDHHQIAGHRSRAALEKVANEAESLRPVIQLINSACKAAGSGARIEYAHLQDAATIRGLAL